MGVPVVYRKTGEGNIATYSYTDIAEGTGVVVFYGANTKLSGGNLAYFLTSNAIYSNTIAPQVVTDQAGQKFDVDFDVVFNAPKRVKGNAKCSFSLGIDAAGSSSHQIHGLAKLRKVSGGVETEIVSGEGEVYNNTSIAPNAGRTFCVNLPVTTMVSFKKDDILRLTLEVYGHPNSAGTGGYAFGCDPKDRNDDNAAPAIPDTVTTILELHVPFILDL